jgi:reductive dehalogenase
LLDRRHIYSRDGNKDIVFEKAEKPKKEGNKLIIPEKCKYAIALSIQMPLDNLQCAPTAIAGAAASLGYSRCEFLVGALAEFIRGLGYNAIPSVNDLGSSVAIAVDAGLGELGRTNRLIIPELGHAVRLAKVITDLPMATDKPISFGLLEFCKVCKRCAEACPPGVLSFNDEPDFKVRGEWNNPGHQAWFEDAPKCLAYWRETTTGCSICLSVCPWSKKDKTILHSMVKASSSKMPFLDGILTSMDKTFGYGRQKDPEKWWELDLPEYGIDTPQGKE